MGRLKGSFQRAESGLNRAVAESAVGRYFKLDARKTSFTKELRAGLATFLTMAYIISVNSSVLTDSGGPCSVADCTPAANSTAAPGPGCKFEHNPGYESCLARTKSDLVVATILTAAAGCIAMGALANLPLALAPAMGANAYFTYSLVGFHGSGPVPYGAALGAVMLEGCLFLALSALGLRAKLARLIPRPIRLASAAGIGLFLAFTGLQAQQGVGLVGPSPSTLVTLAACARTDPATGACAGGTMLSPTFWLGAAGFLLTAVCLAKKVNGGMIYGIVFVTALSWFRGTAVTFFPATPAGEARFAYFKKVVDFHVIERTAGKIAFTHFNRSEFWISMLTLLYVDILDTTGSMYSMAEYGGFTDERGRFEGEYRAFMVDAGATVVSTALGGTTATTFIESTAGMREGGRTGLTAVAAGLCFVASLFLTPLFTSVPPWAVGPALVAVGAMMMRVAGEVEWADARQAVPAFLTMLLMPLTYSIANGIIAGVGLYIAMGAYDAVAGMVRWVAEAKRVMAEERNQVSAAGNDVPPPPPLPPV